MDIVKIKLGDLKLTEDNVRMHPKNQISEYMRSLEMFGQTKNAVVDENNQVLIGNGLVIAARELGWEEIAVIKRTDLTENDKLKLMVSDNKIYGLGVDNLDAVDAIFERLKVSGDLDIPGYDEEMLKTIVADADAVADSLVGYGSLSEDEINNIRSRPEPKSTFEEKAPDDKTEEHATPAPNNGAEDKEGGADDRISFKCPKCGEETWLSKDALRRLLS
jgi:hypothetical protein